MVSRGGVGRRPSCRRKQRGGWSSRRRFCKSSPLHRRSRRRRRSRSRKLLRQRQRPGPRCAISRLRPRAISWRRRTCGRKCGRQPWPGRASHGHSHRLQLRSHWSNAGHRLRRWCRRCAKYGRSGSARCASWRHRRSNPWGRFSHGRRRRGRHRKRCRCKRC